MLKGILTASEDLYLEQEISIKANFRTEPSLDKATTHYSRRKNSFQVYGKTRFY